MIRPAFALALALAMAVPLAACGRKGNPDAPEGATYPRTYPYTPMPAGQPGQGSRTTAPDDSGYQVPQPRLGAPRPLDPKPPAAESGPTQ